ncbi:MAG: MFS transporter [Clostridiales bacterium]|nr:MFS transporter [Clostridiales bacterium]
MEQSEKIFSKEYVVCMIANFLCSMNFLGLLTTTSSYAIVRFGVSDSMAGFAASVVVIGGLISRAFAGRYALAVGYRRMLTIGLAVNAASTFAYLTTGNFAVFCLIRFVNGLAFGTSSNTAITIATSLVPKNRSGEGVGYFSISQILGTALGPLLMLQLLQNGGYNEVFLFAAIAPAAALPLMLFMKLPKFPGSKTEEEAGLPTIAKFLERKVLPIAAICFVLYLGYAAFASFVEIFAVNTGLNRTVPFIFVTYAIALVATRPFVSKLFDRRGPNIILYPGIALFAVGLLLLARTETDAALLLSGALMGVGLGAVQAGTLAIVVGLVPRRRLAIANGTYYMALDGATAVGPVIAGLLIDSAGFSGMYIVMAVCAACCVPLYYALHGRKARG